MLSWKPNAPDFLHINDSINCPGGDILSLHKAEFRGQDYCYGVYVDGVFVGFVSDIVVQGGFEDAEGVYKRGEEIYIWEKKNFHVYTILHAYHIHVFVFDLHGLFGRPIDWQTFPGT